MSNFPELKTATSDKRGSIYLIENLLSNNAEFTFMEIKSGFARGGCYHEKDERFVVLSGYAEYITVVKGQIHKLNICEGIAGFIPAGLPHAFVALTDCIISEWGISTEEKLINKKHELCFDYVKTINEKQI